ncbi:IS30 family transposase [Streptococcus suis]
MSANYTTDSSRGGKHLTFTEPQLIEIWKNKEQLSNCEIARRLDKSPQTIHNEMKRSLVDLTYSLGSHEYSSVVAQENYDLMRFAVGKTDTWSPEKEQIIKTGILNKISIVVISKYKNMPCPSTIYSWVRKNWISGISRSDLIYPRKPKKEIPGPTTRIPRKKDALSIDDRPDFINNRDEAGHFEIDLVILNKRKGMQLLTLVDRKTRYAILQPVEDKSIESINKVMVKLKEIYHFKSITADRKLYIYNSHLLNKKTLLIYSLMTTIEEYPNLFHSGPKSLNTRIPPCR